MPRPTRIHAPPGHKGCPKCGEIYLLPDYGKSTYCRKCNSKTSARSHAKARLVAEGASPDDAEKWLRENPKLAQATTTIGIIRKQMQENLLLSLARRDAPEFPIKPREDFSRCWCCFGSKDVKMLGPHAYCWRCHYYVSQCGRCLAHALREYVPELLGRPDPPLLDGDLGYNGTPLKKGERDTDEDEDKIEADEVRSRPAYCEPPTE